MKTVTQTDLNNRPRYDQNLSYAQNLSVQCHWQRQYNDCTICYNHNNFAPCAACGWYGYAPPRKVNKMKKQISAKQIINRAYNYQQNIVTPIALKYRKLGQTSAVELSTGRGIFGAPRYGVSVVRHGQPSHDESTSFDTLYAAREYFQNLTDRKGMRR